MIFLKGISLRSLSERTDLVNVITSRSLQHALPLLLALHLEMIHPQRGLMMSKAIVTKIASTIPDILPAFISYIFLRMLVLSQNIWLLVYRSFVIATIKPEKFQMEVNHSQMYAYFDALFRPE